MVPSLVTRPSAEARALAISKPYRSVCLKSDKTQYSIAPRRIWVRTFGVTLGTMRRMVVMRFAANNR